MADLSLSAFSLEVWVGWGVLGLVVVILKSVEFFYCVAHPGIRVKP